jgi:hypothetical protein
MMLARLWLTWRQRRAQTALSSEQRAQQEAALIDAYRATFGGERGRLVLADILRRGGLMSLLYRPGDAASSSEATMWREGRRSLALEIVEMVNRDPDAALAMARTGEVADLLEEGDRA